MMLTTTDTQIAEVTTEMEHLQQFSVKHARAITLLSRGFTQKATGKAIGVSQQTVAGWLRRPEFKEAVAQTANERLRSDEHLLRSFYRKGLRKLAELVDHPNPRVSLKAATEICRLNFLNSTEQVKQQLEQLEAEDTRRISQALQGEV